MSRQAVEVLAAIAIATAAVAVSLHERGNEPAPTPPVLEDDPPTAEAIPRIQVVFALDTTGSMGGLIEGAKAKIWSIANHLASGQPRPEIEFGLVAYRDRGDEYVAKSVTMTRDLDDVHAALAGLSANGGGDHPEDVNRALELAIRGTQWDTSDKTLRLLFLVGDAPAHDDYADEPSTEVLAKEARQRGIVVNTVLCGSDGAAMSTWKLLAAAAGGEFTAIEQDGGVIAIATPFDAELQALNGALAGTVLGFGSVAEQEASRGKMAARKAMAPAAAADAASYSAKAGAMNKEDLVGAVEGGLDLAKLDPAALPAELQGLSPTEQKAAIEKRKEEREDLEKKVLELAKQRDAYLEKTEKETGAADGFDAKVVDTLRRQAAGIGVSY